jgi:hypothetical protein
VIGSLSAQPTVLLPGGIIKLTANGVADDELITKVEFYRDINKNGLLELGGDNPDLLLGTDNSVEGGWTLPDNFDTTGLALGTYGFLARAQDNKNAFSNVVKVNVTLANPCAISGSIFNDLNGNGVKNSGEKGLANWRVYIDENNNKKFDLGIDRSVKTDSAGRWTLNPAHFGTNRIRYVAPKGWQATTASTLTFKLSSASCQPAQLFGVKKIV